MCVTQVSTTEQVGRIMVHVYPFLPLLDKTLGAAASRGGVHHKDIPPAALENPEQFAAEWGQLEAYVAKATTQVCHEYVPLGAL